MIAYNNECVCCPPEMGCLGFTCPNLNVPRFYCDGCEEEYEYYYGYEGEYFCEECFLEKVMENAKKYTAADLIGKG